MIAAAPDSVKAVPPPDRAAVQGLPHGSGGGAGPWPIALTVVGLAFLARREHFRALGYVLVPWALIVATSAHLFARRSWPGPSL